MKRDNRGFSLLELIVVIAIAAIMLWLVVPAVGAQFSSEAMTTANAINSAIGKCKFDNMTLSAATGENHSTIKLDERKVFLTIEERPDGIYATVKSGGSATAATQKLASSRVGITPESVKMTFNRATGTLEKWETDDGDTLPLDKQHIEVKSKTNGSTYYVDVYTLTGFHEVT